MATFFTSDIHFGDERIMKLCHRPFQTVQEMDEYIVKRWNERVAPNDTVWILGDLVEEEHFDKELLNRLNGKIKFLIGNHDYVSHGLVMDNTKIYLFVENPYYFDDAMFRNSIKPALFMFHYPMADWNGRENGVVHLYGHVHNKLIKGLEEYYADKLAFNVSMDANEFEPKTLKELVIGAGKLQLYRQMCGEFVRGFDD